MIYLLLFLRFLVEIKNGMWAVLHSIHSKQNTLGLNFNFEDKGRTVEMVKVTVCVLGKPQPVRPSKNGIRPLPSEMDDSRPPSFFREPVTLKCPE